MAGTISTGSVSRLLQDGVASVFGDALKQHDPKWPMMFAEHNSRKAF